MKKLVVLAAVLSAGIAAKAEYLYWQVNPSDVAADVGEYNAAYLYVVNDNNKEVISVTGWDTPQHGKPLSASERVATGNLITYMDGQYGMLVELVNWNSSTGSGTVVGRSETSTYTEWSQKVMVDENSWAKASDIPLQMVWMPSNIAPVPEPTSGLLMLLGLSALALRRKRT